MRIPLSNTVSLTAIRADCLKSRASSTGVSIRLPIDEVAKVSLSYSAKPFALFLALCLPSDRLCASPAAVAS